MNKPSYRFYATLLDGFQSYLDSDMLWEQFYGDSEDAPYSPEEFAAKQEKELIDRVNRAPFVSEPASLGTAFNEIVDCIILRVPATREDCIIASDKESNTINATIDGFDFKFDSDLCRKMADYFSDCIPQYRCSAEIDTKYGAVELYGNIDYCGYNKIYDLKTTKNYSAFGKFENHWQRYVYPYCLLKTGLLTEVMEFEFTVCKLKSTQGVIGADIYKEVYTHNNARAERLLRGMCERFIEWLEAHRAQITDKKIFGGEND